jgi:peptidoglycan/LPS O-acetylase OafA/YrhL
MFLVFSNIFIFMQDFVFFLGFDSLGNIQFVKHFNNSFNFPIYKYLYLPQGWSLAIELTFYIFAPFICKNKIFIITFFLISLISLVYFQYLGLDFDPWNRRFFLNELFFFLLGSLAYYSGIYFRRIGIYLFIFFIFCLIAYSHFNIIFKDVFIYLFLFLIINTIYKITKSNKIDRYLGNISYLIYINHLFILSNITNRLPILNSYEIFPILGKYCIIILMAVIMFEFIQKKINLLKKKFI